MRTPKEVIELTYNYSQTKCNLSLKRLSILSILAGMYISMGALLAIIVGFGVPEISENNPAIARILMGVTFPIGLAFIIIFGAELFTGNCSTLIPSLLTKRLKWSEALRNWGLVWIGNFIGTLLFSYIMVYSTGVISAEPWAEAVNNLAVTKTTQSFFEIFIKGVGANWFVCLAIWATISAKTQVGKIVSLWLPITAFIIIGYEHSVANMSFISMAMFQGADISISEFLFNNIIPSTLGNVLGGAIFVGGVYGYLNKEK